MNISEAKARIRIPDLWAHFNLPGEPRASCKSPFRDESKPSFSVDADGTLWNDFATGEAGDAVDFFQRASGLGRTEACRKFIELAGGSSAPWLRTAGKQPAEPKPGLPGFRKGTLADFLQLSIRRNIGREGLELASERGLLWFATLKDCPAWIITDSERVNAQARRMDGEPWEHIAAKAWTLPGSRAAWPLGIKEAQPFQSIALCEGGPDFLAAHYLALWEQAPNNTRRDVRCVPVAMIGAKLRIPEDALPLFTGKRVRIFGHADDAGRAAADTWARQLESVGADVDAFDFAGLVMADGSPAKDLNDCLNLNADGFRQTEGILP